MNRFTNCHIYTGLSPLTPENRLFLPGLGRGATIKAGVAKGDTPRSLSNIEYFPGFCQHAGRPVPPESI